MKLWDEDLKSLWYMGIFISYSWWFIKLIQRNESHSVIQINNGLMFAYIIYCTVYACLEKENQKRTQILVADCL